MVWIGMCALGVFVGYLVTFGLRKIPDASWGNPSSVFSAVISADPWAAASFAFPSAISSGGDKLGPGLFLYPIGLAYGRLLRQSALGRGIELEQPSERRKKILAALFISGFALASVLLLLIFLSATFRGWLPA